MEQRQSTGDAGMETTDKQQGVPAKQCITAKEDFQQLNSTEKVGILRQPKSLGTRNKSLDTPRQVCYAGDVRTIPEFNVLKNERRSSTKKGKRKCSTGSIMSKNMLIAECKRRASTKSITSGLAFTPENSENHAKKILRKGFLVKQNCVPVCKITELRRQSLDKVRQWKLKDETNVERLDVVSPGNQDLAKCGNTNGMSKYKEKEALEMAKELQNLIHEDRFMLTRGVNSLMRFNSQLLRRKTELDIPGIEYDNADDLAAKHLTSNTTARERVQDFNKSLLLLDGDTKRITKKIHDEKIRLLRRVTSATAENILKMGQTEGIELNELERKLLSSEPAKITTSSSDTDMIHGLYQDIQEGIDRNPHYRDQSLYAVASNPASSHAMLKSLVSRWVVKMEGEHGLPTNRHHSTIDELVDSRFIDSLNNKTKDSENSCDFIDADVDKPSDPKAKFEKLIKRIMATSLKDKKLLRAEKRNSIKTAWEETDNNEQMSEDKETPPNKKFGDFPFTNMVNRNGSYVGSPAVDTFSNSIRKPHCIRQRY